MKKQILAAFLGAACLSVAGCSDFLSSTDAIKDPNNPTKASVDQSFVAVQSNGFAILEGAVPHDVCMWMQQCGGVGGRTFEQQGKYSIQPSTVSGDFTGVYVGGGLVDLRRIQSLADASGDKFYGGVARVWEAILMSFAADVWGDIPYSVAVSDSATPPFDPQMQVYDDLLALLDKAIADLGGAGDGPGAVDLIYEGNNTKWIQAAHTLKARIHLRLVERNGVAEYTTANNEAQLGISAAANDFKSLHTSATPEKNMWAQFQNTSFGPDLVAGSVLVNIMTADADPRLPEYFGLNQLGGYGGYDVTTQATPANQISPIIGSGRTNNEAFAQPLITWEETQLIRAEAELMRPGGSQGAAQPFLDAVRAAHGKGTVPATLANIMREKYISMFQNVETWSDWRRTCLPALTPARNRAAVPGRLYYGETEEQTNSNFPTTPQNLFTVRNWNDPNGC